jgi:hypothetical protein
MRLTLRGLACPQRVALDLRRLGLPELVRLRPACQLRRVVAVFRRPPYLLPRVLDGRVGRRRRNRCKARR